MSGFVQTLSKRHSLTNPKTKLAAGFLLERRSGKGSRWSPFERLDFDAANFVFGANAFVQECFGIGFGFDPVGSFRFEDDVAALFVFDIEQGFKFEVGFGIEIVKTRQTR